MSRCFSFPPPGFSAKINETLIESIKLQRETEKAKAERKKERRREKKEKKEKRREKKEKDNPSNAIVSGLDEKRREDDTKTKKRKREEEKDRKSGEKRKRGEEKDKKSGEKRKRQEDKTPKQHSEKKNDTEEKSKLDDKKAEIERVNTNELLERSDLTQEHEQPFCSQNAYCLSDSSENSNQRRQQAATQHESTVAAQGKQLIRIRLPSLKNIQHPAVVLSTSKDEQPCSISGRADPEPVVLPTNEEKTSYVAAATKGIISDLNLNKNMKQVASIVASSSSSSFDKKMKKVELVYKAVVENWGPPPLDVKMSEDTNDLDWLMKRSERCKPAVAAASNNSVVGEERFSTMWPKAHYIAEADTYLMPFTIPF